MKIYVDNLPYRATDTDLKKHFEPYGKVAAATINLHQSGHHQGKSNGSGTVVMENRQDGERAIAALNNQKMMGRPLRVKEDQPAGHQPPSDKTIATHDEHDSFHNPYTFVPTSPREKAIENGGFGGDFNPLEHPRGKEYNLDHASLKPNLWTGHIPIKLTTITPLVLLKSDGRTEDSNEPYDVYDRIRESSLRGMLRSAYEVVTNSRYACFGREHKERLAYRMDTREAPKLIPAIIKRGNKPGKLAAHLYTGTSIPTSKGPKRNGSDDQRAMYAAMLDQGLQYVHGGVPKTGDTVWAQITLYEHERPFYLYWAADKVWSTQQQPNKPNTLDPNDPYVRIVKGYVFITNKNIKRKHDERIFFYDNPKTPQIKEDITNAHEEAWENLIRNYRDAHSEKDIFDRPSAENKPWKKIGDDPGETAWSPHLYQDSKHQAVWRTDPRGRTTTHDAIKLQEGDMVYARCDFTGNTISGIKGLFPVTISRELYQNTPEDLLDPSLRPATELDQLSPADRLFGWTPHGQGSDSGYKSRIRVVCEDSECPTTLKDFENAPLPLTILGQPKPEQGRFYVAADDKGTPQNQAKNKKDAGYDKEGDKQLRGRKHYWHHKGFEADKNNPNPYWDPLQEQDQEYIRAGRVIDTQNRSIKGWIEPGNEFEATLYVQNLQPEEVGALLWLLTLNDNLGEGDDKHYFKLGYGKPLGFGSVKIEIDTARVKNGCLPLGTEKNWKAYYAEFDVCPPATMDKAEQDNCLKIFTNSMLDAYKSLNQQNFKDLPFTKGFLRVLQGPSKDIPIHYPRTKSERDPDGKNFEWFMDNERGRSYSVAGRSEVGKQLPLPEVTADKGLSYIPSDPKPKN